MDTQKKGKTDYKEIRIEKLEKIKELGINPYPDKFEKTHSLIEAKQLEDETQNVKIAGRLLTIRIMGKLSFCTLFDETGKIQIAFERDTIGSDTYNNFFKKLIDIGDIIGVSGKIFTTHKGEKTLLVEELQLLSKALRPLPEKFHGVQDTETIYRQRYLDLIMNEETLRRFKLRTETIKLIRKYLEKNNFFEVETPVLQSKPSGAIAKPFITHHNALDIDVYLRIAPETYLKRLIVAGFDKVYEFARCFRNEGIDPSHLQDFTMLEYYCAYWNYEDNMNFTEKLIKHVIKKIFGKLEFSYQGTKIDLKGNWPRVSFRDLILEDAKIDINEIETADDFRKLLKEKKIEIEDSEKLGLGNLIDQVYKKVSRPKLINPVFLISHPTDLSPLARRNDENPSITDRFQLVINSWEIVNAYSELIDPLDQRQRLEEQAKLKSGGDDEAMVMDEDYLMSMEYGMPPVSGWGMGIDRFVCLIADKVNLRDVIFFPLMRSKESEK